MNEKYFPVVLCVVIPAAMLVAVALVMRTVDTTPAPTPPRTCLQSLSGYIPEHQGFYTTGSGDTISYAIPAQERTHCVRWSE